MKSNLEYAIDIIFEALIVIQARLRFAASACFALCNKLGAVFEMRILKTCISADCTNSIKNSTIPCRHGKICSTSTELLLGVSSSGSLGAVQKCACIEKETMKFVIML